MFVKSQIEKINKEITYINNEFTKKYKFIKSELEFIINYDEA